MLFLSSKTIVPNVVMFRKNVSIVIVIVAILLVGQYDSKQKKVLVANNFSSILGGLDTCKLWTCRLWKDNISAQGVSAATLLATVVIFYSTYGAELKVRRLQSKKEHVDAQLKELYGPLYANQR